VDVGLRHVQVAVAVHAPQAVADLSLGSGEDPLGVAGIITGEEGEPCLLVPGLLLGADGRTVRQSMPSASRNRSSRARSAPEAVWCHRATGTGGVTGL
jgi:hypothetical protein